MDAEEKVVFKALDEEKEDEAAEFGEIDDDFILMLNDGKPALELITEEESKAAADA